MATTRVQLPDGNIGEFPAGMSTADIETVLQKQYPPPGPTQNPISQALDKTREFIGQQKPVPPPGSGIDRPITEIGNMGNQFLQAIYDIPPPNVANELYKKRAGLPNRLSEIPAEAVMTVGPMALGGEERPYTPGAPVTETPRPAITPETAAPSSGLSGAAWNLAGRVPVIGKYIRAADVLGDLLDTIKGKPEAPSAPAPPSVPPYWGKQVGRDIGPLEEWGQQNPPSLQSASPQPQAAATPAPRVTGPVIEQQVRQALGAPEPTGPAPGRPIYQRAVQSPTAAPNDIPPITSVDSTALNGYHYNPGAKEFTVQTQDGNLYRYAQVTPEQAEAFKAAKSKGRAWQVLRDDPDHVLVAKNYGQGWIRVGPSAITASPESEPGTITPLQSRIPLSTLLAAGR